MYSYSTGVSDILVQNLCVYITCPKCNIEITSPHLGILRLGTALEVDMRNHAFCLGCDGALDITHLKFRVT